MVTATTLTLIIISGIFFALIVTFAFVEGRRVIKGRKLLIKTPKVRGRAIIQDLEKFGSAVVTGYQMADGMKAGWLFLRSRDDVDFKQFYHKSELVPDNAILAVAGIDRALWHVRSKDNSVDYEKMLFEKQKSEAEARNLRMQEEMKEQKVKHDIKLNQAAALPDMLEDIFREGMKPKEREIVVGGKR